jgi:hypothetical protein
VPDDTLVYLYGLLAADAPSSPSALTGVDGGTVRLVRAGPLTAIVSDVDAKAYSEVAIAHGLTDVRWAGERAADHERVLTWFVDRTTVVPSSPFSLHESDARLIARIDGQRDAMLRALERLAGHQELGVRVWRDEEAFARQLIERSPALRTLEEERANATPGRRYLIAKRIEALRAAETERVTAEAMHGAFGELSAAARQARALPLPADRVPQTRTLVLDAVFLVPESSGEDFRRIVGRHVAERAESGFSWDFTGPWPPYHFVDGG